MKVEETNYRTESELRSAIRSELQHWELSDSEAKPERAASGECSARAELPQHYGVSPSDAYGESVIAMATTCVRDPPCTIRAGESRRVGLRQRILRKQR